MELFYPLHTTRKLVGEYTFTDYCATRKLVGELLTDYCTTGKLVGELFYRLPYDPETRLGEFYAL